MRYELFLQIIMLTALMVYTSFTFMSVEWRQYTTTGVQSLILGSLG